MKKVVPAVLLLVAVAAVLVLLREPPPPTSPPPQAQAPDLTTKPVAEPEPVVEKPAPEPIAAEQPSAPVAVTPEQAPVPESATEIAIPEAPKPARMVTILPGQPVARVNQQPILLADLIPVAAQDEGQEVTMDAEEFSVRLKEAIDTVLTYQLASNRNVTLSADQMAVVDSVRSRKEADIQGYRDQGVLWTSVTEEQITFQQRYVAALLLQKNLMGNVGDGTVTITDDDVATYYQQNASAYPPLPADPAQREQAWADIQNQIRMALLQRSHEQEMQAREAFLLQMRAGAAIEELPVSSRDVP